MPLMETAFLLNPPRRRRRGRRRRVRRARRMNQWYGQPRRHAAASRKGWRKRRRRSNPLWRTPRGRYSGLRGRGYRRLRVAGRKGGWKNPMAYMNRGRRRRRGGRRRNPPQIRGLIAAPDILPAVRVPVPGILGDIVNGVVQGALAGGLVFGGYVSSGMVVDLVWSSTDAAAAPDALRGKFLRPILFGVTAGLFGGLSAMIAPAGRKTTFGLLGAAGPGLRAFGGFVAAIAPDTDIGRQAATLADYLQVGPAPANEVSDYLQVEPGMSELYEAGMGEELYEAGMGQEEEEEVIGL